MEKKREQFSNIGFVLAAAGSAVGLGNIWKFPNLAGANGGGFFLLFYVIFIIVLGVPLLLGESAIGRYAQVGPTGAYKKIAMERGRSGFRLKFWTFIGFLGSFANFLILCYYSVISGWILQYCFKVFFVSINDLDMGVFQETIAAPVTPIIFALIFIAVTVFINMKGVSGGIEKVSSVLMPILLILLIMLFVFAFFTLTLDGAMDGVKYLFIPSVEQMNRAGGIGQVALAALGQCFFSLNLGVGTMITFGSYLDRKSNLVGQTYGIPIVSCVVAVLAGVVTLPAVFAVSSITGIDPTSQTGPGMLMYAFPQSLHAAFGPTLGTILACVMYILVVFAALTSTTAMFSVTVNYIIDYKQIEKKKAMIGLGIAIGVGAVICSLSNGDILGGIRFGGLIIQDALDWLNSNFLMPVGALCLCIFIGYVWKSENAIQEITNNGKRKFSWALLFKWFMMFIDPIIIIAVFLSGIGIL